MRASSRELQVAVLGSGRGSNCQALIDAIGAGTLRARIVCVISDVTNAGILALARRHGLSAHHIDGAPYRTKLDGAAEQECLDLLRACGTEVVVLAGFMRIIKRGLLTAFPQRVLNIHPSLLPSFPGTAAWKQALEHGVKVTGCTVHLVDEGTDTGPILVQRPVPVHADDTPETLHARIQEQEHLAYPEALRMFTDGPPRIEGRRVCVDSPSLSGTPPAGY